MARTSPGPTLLHATLTDVSANQHHTPTARATVAAMEAETDEATYASPNRVVPSPGVAKAYCQVDLAGLLVANSFNVASVTDTETGSRIIVWDTDFSNANYALVSSLLVLTADLNIKHSTLVVGSARMDIRNINSDRIDAPTASVAFGDQ